ncbi:LexA family protein [Klebsiella pneumoniae]|uniref:LexA family protein n=1 Tax=Klebsiella pneumoniae TaxID=573 RepID=UPI001CF3A0C5|nr:DNA-binding protein [Klebsiella pneumoniae]MCA6702365.1 DNA-binding protein [Klebsiella pneumoniae]
MTQTPEVSKSHQTGAPSSSAGLLSSSKLTFRLFRLQEVFDLLVAYINQHSYPPTLSELADMLGVSSSNAVLLHLRALERKNFIKLSRRVSRGISIVGRKEPMLAVQLLQEMIAEEPGAQERAIEFLRLFGDQP